MFERNISNQIAEISNKFKKEKNFWLKKLSGEITKSVFPIDYKIKSQKDPTKKENLTSSIDFSFHHDLFSKIMKLSKNNDYSFFAILASTLAILLKKYTNNPDIIIGAPIYKQELKGKYLNTVLILRSLVFNSMSFKEVLLESKKSITEAEENQNYPIEKLINDLNLKIDNNSFPLIDITILLDNIHDCQYISHIPHNINITFSKKDQSIQGIIKYNPLKYKKITIEKIATHFENLMNSLIDKSNLKISEFDLLSSDEKKQILYDFNNTTYNYSSQKMIHQIFSQQSEITPDYVALIGKNSNSKFQQSMTYRELNRSSNYLSQILNQLGEKKGSYIGIMMERSLEMLIGILGILKSSAAYVPIDPNTPIDRIAFMINDTNVKVLLTTKPLQELKVKVKPIDISNIFQNLPSSSNLDVSYSPLNPTNPAYLIYTSGSTGKPKGVIIQHISLINILIALQNSYPLLQSDVYLFKTAFIFDVSITELFGWIFGYGRLKILEQGNEKDPFRILTCIEQEKISHINFVPSMFKAMITVLNKENIHKLSSLKYIFLAGEILSPEIIEKFFRINNNKKLKIENIYGPTEATIYASSYGLSQIYHNSDSKLIEKSIPIGKPFPNIKLYILNEHTLKLQPIGISGELHISGAGVARGYLNLPELTRKNFISFQSLSSQMIYKTGDLAKWQYDGNIEFLGRKDNQVKIRGYRIELGEIENKLRKYKILHDSNPIKAEEIKSSNDLEQISRCNECLLPLDMPEIEFNEEGICSICQQYKTADKHIQNYFRNKNDFLKLIENTNKSSNKNKEYDCLLMLSGGKDSTYVLYQLKDMGLKILAYTFDNGHMSETSIKNLKKTTSELGVDHIFHKPNNLNNVFVESLRSYHNVCPACWHATNTYAGKIAHKKGIPLVISALSRAQIINKRLFGLFQGGIFNQQEIEDKLLLFRKQFHSKDNKFSIILGESLAEKTVEQLHFIDFFRYFDVSSLQIKHYLSEKNWINPKDTGFWSSDCKLKDLGIFMHYRHNGFHLFDILLSWQCRLKEIKRSEALKRMAFNSNLQNINKILNKIGYYTPIKIQDAVVIDNKDEEGNKSLYGYFISKNEIEISHLKDFLSKELPEYMIPNLLMRIEKIPLTPSGKIDRLSFPTPSISNTTSNFIPPKTKEEKELAEIWKNLLNVDNVGIHDNFFSIGGDSISSILVVSQAQENGLNISTQLLFQYPTISGMLNNIENTNENDKKTSIDSSQPFGLISQEDIKKIPEGIEDAYPMRMIQIDFLMYSESIHGTSSHHFISPFKLKGQFNRKQFSMVVKHLVKRHPVFRTSYDLHTYSQYLQLVHKKIPLPLIIEDIRGLNSEEQNKIIEIAKKNEREQEFDWRKPGLIRFLIHILNDETFHCIFSFHNSILDGWSTMLLLTELYSQYHLSLKNNQLQKENKLNASFKDLIALELEIHNSNDAKDFWLKFLNGSPMIRLPRLPKSRIRQKNIKPRIYPVNIPQQLAKTIKSTAENLNVPIKHLMLTCHCAVLGMLTNQTDIVTGYELNARPEKKDGDKTIGLLINIIPFRLKLTNNTWEDLIKSSYKTEIDLLPYRRYSLAKMKEILKKQRIFEVVFNYTHFREYKQINDYEEIEVTGTDEAPEWEYILRAEFGLNAITDEVMFYLYYHSNIFNEDQLKHFAACYKTILQRITNHPTSVINLEK